MAATRTSRPWLNIRTEDVAVAAVQTAFEGAYVNTRDPAQPKRSSGQSAAPRQRDLAKPANTMYQKQSRPDMPAEPVFERDFSI